MKKFSIGVVALIALAAFAVYKMFTKPAVAANKVATNTGTGGVAPSASSNFLNSLRTALGTGSATQDNTGQLITASGNVLTLGVKTIGDLFKTPVVSPANTASSPVASPVDFNIDENAGD